MSRLRGTLYRTARTLGDIESLSSPRRFVRRQIRRQVYRQLFRVMRKVTR